jgi:hypothetical protein
MLSEFEAHRLLEDLCIKLGFCLPPEEQSKLRQDPPDGVRAFTDAVLLAEGFDVELVDRHLYRQVRDMIAAAFERSGYDGA